MPDLKTLQFPRYLHHPRHGSKLVQSAVDGAEAFEAGWVLSPNDFVRDSAVPESTQPDETDSHEDAGAEAGAAVPEPDVPAPKRRGRPKKP